MEKVYQIALNEREYDALPILLHMAFVYSWELFEKKKGVDIMILIKAL